MVLEISDSERTQQLSLLDGSRVESDVEEYYSTKLSASAGDVWWEFRDEAAAGEEIISAGLVNEVAMLPAVPYFGWAAPGHAFISVDFDHLSQVSGFSHTGNVTLTLTDASEISAEETDYDPFTFAEGPSVWFQVPLDTDSASLNVHITGSLDDTQLDFGVTEIPLTFGE